MEIHFRASSLKLDLGYNYTRNQFKRLRERQQRLYAVHKFTGVAEYA
jgi:hypothetical protein